MKILSLDLSTKRSGYATYNTETKELDYGVIASASQSVEKRICIMRDELKKILEDFKPDAIIAEDVVSSGGNAHTGKVLTWLQGVVAITVYEYNSKVKFELIGASSWRSKIGLQGYRITRDKQKLMDIEYANKKYGLSLTSSQDDEADAINIMDAYLNGAATAEVVKSKNDIGSEESAF